MSVGDLAVLLIAALSVAFIGWAVVRLTSGREQTPRPGVEYNDNDSR